MTRLPVVDPATAPEAAAELLAGVQQALGATPNMMKVMANSPATLKGYLDLNAALSKGKLRAATRELVALAVAEANECSYCLSVHTYLAHNLHKQTDAVTDAARRGEHQDPKTAAVLAFALAVLENRGAVDDVDVKTAREAGLSDAELAEVVAVVALNVFTNYFNKAFNVEVDWPVVTPFAK